MDKKCLALAVAGNFTSISEEEIQGMARRSACGALGESVAGETYLHWAVLGGCSKSVEAWLGAGGRFLPDNRGANPMHWLAGAGTGAWNAMVIKEPWRKEFEQACQACDDLSRNAVGILCLARESKNLSKLIHWLPALGNSEARLGKGLALGVFDALLACKASVDVHDLEDGLLAAGAILPSRSLPPQLARSGVWGQTEWDLAREALLGPKAKAEQERQDLAEGVQSSARRSGVPSRI